jgi:hypothetical protein
MRRSFGWIFGSAMLFFLPARLEGVLALPIPALEKVRIITLQLKKLNGYS